jgi:hypothetical protein
VGRITSKFFYKDIYNYFTRDPAQRQAPPQHRRRRGSSSRGGGERIEEQRPTSGQRVGRLRRRRPATEPQEKKGPTHYCLPASADWRRDGTCSRPQSELRSGLLQWRNK